MPGPASTIGTPVEHLDLATVIKVSQAVSGEIVLEKLLDTLMRTAMVQAGAERALLILPQGAEQQIAAEATTTGEGVTVHLRDQAVADACYPRRCSTMSCAPGRASFWTMPRPSTVCRGSIHPSAPDPFSSLPAAAQPGQAHWRAVPGEQSGPSRLRASPHHRAEAARLASSDLAGECPLVPRFG